MTEFKTCFVGYGSIAKRHIKNLLDIFKTKEKVLKIDLMRHGKSYENQQYDNIDRVYCSFDDLPNDYDVIFITNPTMLHYETLKKVWGKAKAFFIEKPVFGLEQADYELPDLSGKICYVACPLRYTPVIEYLKKHITVSDVYSVRAVSSSYLPDWRPDTDYRKSYSAQKSLGGGVAIDLIHEWDYLQYLFGFPEKVSCIKKKVSDLEIDTEDSATYLAELKNMTIELHLDYFGKAALRELMIITKDETLRCNLILQQIEFLNSGKRIDFNSERDYFQTAELKHFLDIIEGKAENSNTIHLAKRVLKLTNGEI